MTNTETNIQLELTLEGVLTSTETDRYRLIITSPNAKAAPVTDPAPVEDRYAKLREDLAKIRTMTGKMVDRAITALKDGKTPDNVAQYAVGTTEGRRAAAIIDTVTAFQTA